MGKGTGRRGLLALGVVAAAGLANVPSAAAVNVAAVTGPSGNSGVVEINGSQAGERNDITIAPSGAAVDADAIDPVFPLAPTSVLVTDTATPLADVGPGCVRVDAHSARCTALSGIDTVDASIGSTVGSSFKVDLGATGAVTPMGYDLSTSDGGDDDISIPVSRDLTIFANAGNDTIRANDPSTVRNVLIRAGTGDDRIELATAAVATVDCGDGADSAQAVGARVSTSGCETVTPGAP